MGEINEDLQVAIAFLITLNNENCLNVQKKSMESYKVIKIIIKQIHAVRSTYNNCKIRTYTECTI
jgi:hypothetical protein